jgi:hypothetical protein
MKAYQVKICVRGNPAATQTAFVEAEDYKQAIIKGIEGVSKQNNVSINDLALVEMHVIEEVLVLADSESHRNREIVGEENAKQD